LALRCAAFGRVFAGTNCSGLRLSFREQGDDFMRKSIIMLSATVLASMLVWPMTASAASSNTRQTVGVANSDTERVIVRHHRRIVVPRRTNGPTDFGAEHSDRGDKSGSGNGGSGGTTGVGGSGAGGGGGAGGAGGGGKGK
jgi:uncharacterized membrane protein YgcG